MSVDASPALVVETVPLSSSPELLDALTDHNFLLWWRHNEGLVGFDPLLTLSFSGPKRIADAAAEWKALSSAATLSDDVNRAGTGLVAFGTFTFDETSGLSSVLIVPRVILGHRSGVSWLTRTSFADEQLNPLTPDSAETLLVEMAEGVPPERTPLHVSFTPGVQSVTGFHESVTSAVEHISQGRVEKVVLSRDIRSDVAPQDLRPALRKLAESYPDCWTFSVDGLFGSSPETLISVHDQHVSARVLAGTARRGSDTHTDLENAAGLASSNKDLDEHGYAARSVLDALTPFTSSLSVSETPFTLKLPNLWHLATDIAGSLTDEASSLDLVEALHPTAAVAGTPTAAAVELIRVLEPFDRGRYAGPVGWVDSSGDGEWAIALRCAQISDGMITAYAGGGIVSSSIPESEFIETEMKFRPILDALS